MFAGCGSGFNILAGLTPRRFRPEEDGRLPELGYGLTNIVHRPTRAASGITPEEYAEGRARLRAVIERFWPRVVCFVGKGVYLAYSGRREAGWGVQEPPVVLGVIDYVAPSSSGLVRLPLVEVAALYRRLPALAGRAAPGPPAEEQAALDRAPVFV